MKKKILSAVLVLTFVLFTLSGCSLFSSNKAKTSFNFSNISAKGINYRGNTGNNGAATPNINTPNVGGGGTYKSTCAKCHGSGTITCYSCHGTGQQSKTQYAPNYGYGGGGAYEVHTTCTICHGSGTVTCTLCHGAGSY